MGGRRWTNDEIQTLEDMSGTYTVATIARRLGRSFDSVNLKMNRLGILGFEKSTDLLTMNQLCIMLGVEPRANIFFGKDRKRKHEQLAKDARPANAEEEFRCT